MNNENGDTFREDLRSVFARARLPVMAAPMFLVSGPELVIASARAGIVGTYAAPNARNIDAMDESLARIAEGTRGAPAPWALNMIVHSSYDRFDAEMELVLRYRPRIVTTALGSPRRVLGPKAGARPGPTAAARIGAGLAVGCRIDSEAMDDGRRCGQSSAQFTGLFSLIEWCYIGSVPAGWASATR